MCWTTKNGIRFDSSAFNYVQSSVMEEIADYLRVHYQGFYEILVKVKDAHLFLHTKEGKIFCDLGIYGLQPYESFRCSWVVTKGVRYETNEDPTEEVGYFGGYSYFHDDFYKIEGEEIILH